MQVVKSFFALLNAEHITEQNLSRVRAIIRSRLRRAKGQFAEYPENEIEALIQALVNFDDTNVSGNEVSTFLRIRKMRDRALILMLADTGLRVNEICKLRCGAIDWQQSRALLPSNHGKAMVVRISTRAKDALKDYLLLRGNLNLATGCPLSTLPLFARHDKGAGKKSSH